MFLLRIVNIGAKIWIQWFLLQASFPGVTKPQVSAAQLDYANITEGPRSITCQAQSSRKQLAWLLHTGASLYHFLAQWILAHQCISHPLLHNTQLLTPSVCGSRIQTQLGWACCFRASHKVTIKVPARAGISSEISTGEALASKPCAWWWNSVPGRWLGGWLVLSSYLVVRHRWSSVLWLVAVH